MNVLCQSFFFYCLLPRDMLFIIIELSWNTILLISAKKAPGPL